MKKSSYKHVLDNSSQNHAPPTASELSDYLNNKLSPEARHAFELRLLDDPLLAEGLDGWKGSSQRDVLSITKSLNRQVRKRVQRERTTGKFSFWQLAASVLLLVVGGLVLFGVLDQVGAGGEDNLAQKTESVPAIEAEEAFTREKSNTAQREAITSKKEQEETLSTEKKEVVQAPTETEEIKIVVEEEEIPEMEEVILMDEDEVAKEKLVLEEVTPRKAKRISLQEQSLPALEDRLVSEPEDATLLFEVAKRYYQNGQPQVAMIYLEKMQLRESEEWYPEMLFLKANIWAKYAGEPKKAREAYRWLKKNAPQFAQVAQEELKKLPKK